MNKPLLLQLDNGNLVSIISCFFTVMALVFAVYLWLLDHLSEDEANFIKRRATTVKVLNNSMAEAIILKSSDDLKTMIEKVNNQLEIVLNYRFWEFGKHRDDYYKVRKFYRDSRYLLSSLCRYIEDRNSAEGKDSIVSIPALSDEEFAEIKKNYLDGLSLIAELIQTWY